MSNSTRAISKVRLMRMSLGRFSPLTSRRPAESPLPQQDQQVDHSLLTGTQSQPQPQSQPFFDFPSPLATTSAAPNASDFTTAASADPSSYLSFATSSLLGDSTQFGSEAAGFEYAILNAMLNGNGFAVDTNATSSLLCGPSGPSGILAGVGRTGDSDPMLLGSSGGGDGGPSSSDNPFNLNDSSLFGPPPTDSNGPAADSSSSKRPGGSGALTAEEVYRNVTKPYPYAQSYHYLVKHLKERSVAAPMP